MIETEPKRRGTVVRDSEGDLWKRGNTRWTCLTPIGARAEVTSVGRVPPTRLTLEEAQAHCNDPETFVEHGDQ